LPARSSSSFPDSWGSVLLDALRGSAALLVLLDHWRGLFFVSYHEIGVHRLLYSLPYTFTAAGHEAVVIFFVLSGYLIGGNVRRAIEHGRWSWASYLTHRLIRLWMVLIPGLLLCALWDRMHIGNATPPWFLPFEKSETITAFVGTLVFLQGVLVPPFGSDGPLWSIANEFWYYILFPLAFIALYRSTTLRTRLAAAAILLVLGLWLRNPTVFGARSENLTLLPLFPLWLAGVAVAYLPRWHLGNRPRWLAAASYVPFVFLCSRLHGSIGIYSDYLLAGATAAFLWSLLAASNTAPAADRSVRFLRGLANCSYTIYVVHFPFLYLVADQFVRERRWQPTWLHIAAGLGVLAVTLGYAYLIATLTEFHTASVREWVERRV